MNSPKVPNIFSAARARARVVKSGVRATSVTEFQSFIWKSMGEDAAERLEFIRHIPKRRLVIGMCQEPLRQMLDLIDGDFCHGGVWDIEKPFPQKGYDFVALIGQLDAINDLPGTLIHIRNALTPGGLAIASFVGGASLPKLRAAMLAADGDRPAARIHPMVDHRAAPQLLQRAGWSDPVVDTHKLTVRYSSLDRLVHDLRDHGLTSALADPAPPLGKAALARARSAFLDQADEDGKVSEVFEIITLTGRRSLAGT